MVAWERLRANLIVLLKVVAIVAVDVHAHVHLAAVLFRGLLVLVVHVLPLEEQLTRLLIVVKDLVRAVRVDHRYEEEFVALEQDQLLFVLMNQTVQ